MSGACEYKPEFEEEATKEEKIYDVLRLAGLGIVTIFVAWLNLMQPQWIANSLVVSTVIIGGYPIFSESFEALRKGRVNMELSMVIAVVASLALLQFLPAIVITFFALLSEFVEGFIVKKGRKNIQALYDLTPRKAFVKKYDGQIVQMEIEKVRINDIIIVREGDIIPVDGHILKGYSSVDQSSMTGESLPVDKHEGDNVFAGTINLNNTLEILCEKQSTDTTFSKIIHLVEEAETSKAPIQKLSDKLATRLIQFAIGLSVLTYITTQNVVSTLSVIVVAGACGLAVGTPIALLATTGKMSRKGIIVKGGVQIETLKQTSTVVFDKTGTLTKGMPVVSQVISFEPSVEPRKILEYAAIAERNINHKLSEAIEQKAMQENIAINISGMPVDDMSTKGRGISRVYDNHRISVGNREFIQEEISQKDTDIQKILSDKSKFQYLVNEYTDYNGRTLQIVRSPDTDLFQFELTTTFVSVDRRLVGAIFFEDSPRENARDAISKIKSMGIRVVMLTGDNEKIAKRIANDVGIDEYYSNLLPHEKVTKLEEIVKRQKNGSVVMVGDGINDAPALAKADIGIAMGKTGTDVAIETADVILMNEDLQKISYLIRTSKQSLSAIKQNFFGTLSVDGFGFILAYTGHITPLIAALIHVSSELVFMVNSARLIIDR